jgi:hypothetical protein
VLEGRSSPTDLLQVITSGEVYFVVPLSPQIILPLFVCIFSDMYVCAGKESHGLEDSRERKHVEADSVERGYNESFSVGPEFNRAAEFARKAAEESASANAESKEAYKR